MRSAQCTVWSTSAPPPASSASVNHCRWAYGILPLFVPITANTSPSRPASTDARNRPYDGAKRTGYAIIRITPAASQAASMASPSATSVASGFSQSTCAPTAAARSTSPRCRAFSLVTTTASGPQANSSSYEST